MHDCEKGLQGEVEKGYVRIINTADPGSTKII